MTNGGSGPASEKKVILLVEDDDDSRQALTDALEDHGYRVLPAVNGAQALATLKEVRGRCDLILLDLMMPVMNGWDFRRKQKESPEISNIPVLLMSAGARLATASGDLDVAGCVSKPVETTDLIEKVRRHCS